MVLHPGRAARGLFAVVLLAAVGCGQPAGQPAGKVTWKGQPVAGAELAFEPESGPEAAAYGTSGQDGTYSLEFRKGGGLPAGPCKVTITRYTLPNGKPLPEGEEGAALRGDEERVRRHKVVFDKAITPGPNALDFELTKGKASAEPEQ
jgi:hypothetical protein